MVNKKGRIWRFALGAALACMSLLPHAVAGQQKGLWPPSQPLDAAPPASAVIPIWEVGDTQAKRTTFGAFRAGLFDLTTVCGANTVWASPSGSSGTLGCRALQLLDIPSLLSLYAPAWTSQAADVFLASPCGGSGLPSWRAPCAADFAAGLLPPAKVGFSATSRLLGSNASGTGGVELLLGTNISLSGNTLNVATGSGTVTSVTCGTGLNGGTFTTTGTCSLANPSASTLGGIQSVAATASKWVNSISTSGVPGTTQPAFTDLSGSATCAQLPALTGAVTSTAGTCGTSLAASPTLTTPTISGAAKVAGSTPTASCTGLGGSGTSSVLGSDLAMQITMTAATGATSTGTCTITLSATFTNNAICVAGLAGGTGLWQGTSTVIYTTPSSTAPAFTWVNNNNTSLTSLVAGSTYLIDVICFKR